MNFSEEKGQVVIEFRIWKWSIMFRKWMEYSEGWLREKQFDIAVMRRRKPKTCFAVERRVR